MEKENNKLRFLRLTEPVTFNFIPPYLFEQVKNREWEVDKFYQWGPVFLSGPLNYFWALTTDENLVKGIVWATVDPVVEVLVVNIVSVDREYQKNGEILRQTKDFLEQIRPDINKELEVKGLPVNLKEKIMWATTRPRAFEKIGMKRSKRIIMETY